MSSSKQMRSRTSASPSSSPCPRCSSARSSCSLVRRPLRRSSVPSCERGSLSKNPWSRRAGRIGLVIGRSPGRLEEERKPAYLGRDGAPREDQLGDLDAVERCALAQVVAGEEEQEAVLGGGVASDAADQDFVPTGRLAGSRELLDA